MASLLVPVGVWRPSLAAALDVSALHGCPGDGRLFIGLRHGAIMVLRMGGSLQPELLLAGHASPVVALATARQPVDQPECCPPADGARPGTPIGSPPGQQPGDALVLVSLAQAGDIALWAVDENGRCLLHNTMACGPGGDARGLVLAAGGSHAIVWGGSPAAPVVSVVRLATLEIVAQTTLSPPAYDNGARLNAVSEAEDAVPSRAAMYPPRADEIKKSASLDIPAGEVVSADTPKPSRTPSLSSIARTVRSDTAAGAFVAAGAWLEDTDTAVLLGPGAVYTVCVNPATGLLASQPRGLVLAVDGAVVAPRFAACGSPHQGCAYYAASSRVLYGCLDATEPARLAALWTAPSPIVQLTSSHVRCADGSVFAIGDQSLLVSSIAARFADAPLWADALLCDAGIVSYDARHARLLPADSMAGEDGGPLSTSLDKRDLAGITCTAVWERGSDARVFHGMADGSVVLRPLLDTMCVPTAVLSERSSAAASGMSSPAPGPQHHVWSLASNAAPSAAATPGPVVREIAHIDAPADICSAGHQRLPSGDMLHRAAGHHRLSVVDCRTEEYALPRVHQRAITALTVSRSGRLASGDAAGALVVWEYVPEEASSHAGTSADAASTAPQGMYIPQHTFHVHGAPLVAAIAIHCPTSQPAPADQADAPLAAVDASIVPISSAAPAAASTTYVAVDADGGVSVVQADVVLGIVPPRSGRPPVVLVRWTLDRRVALFYRDGLVRIWSLSTLTAHDVASSSADELGAFAFYQELPSHPSYAAAMGAVHPSPIFCNGLLGQALVWRTDAAAAAGCGLRDGRVQAAMLDVRRLVDTLRSRLVDRASDAARVHASNTLLFALGILMPWGSDAAVDSAAEAAGVRRPRTDIVVGMVGANGNTAYPFDAWRSGTMEATLRIACAALLAVPLDLGPQWTALHQALCGARADPQPPRHLPSLSFASKYWHDLGDELRTASRAVVADTLARMPSEVLEHVVAYWTELLPVDEAADAGQDAAAPEASPGGPLQSEASPGAAEPRGAHAAASRTGASRSLGGAIASGRRRMNRAAVILGIIALQRGEALHARLRRRVSDSLLALLTDEKRNLFRGAAIELIGRGYAALWAPHIDAPPVFRLLHTWLASMSQVVDAGGHVYSGADRDPGQHSTAASLGVLDASAAADVSRAMTVSGIGGHSRAESLSMGVAHMSLDAAMTHARTRSSAEPPALQLVVPFESEAAVCTMHAVRRTLVQLGLQAPQRVLPAWIGGAEYAGSRSLVERWTGASLLVEMLQQPEAPSRFAGLGLLFVEAALRLIDPAHSGLHGSGARARLLGVALPLVAETCRVFPTVCYDRAHSRIVASIDAAALEDEVHDLRVRVYDLRASGSSPSVFAGHPALPVDCRVVDGHTRPATAVCATGMDTGPWLLDEACTQGMAAPNPKAALPYASVASYSFGEATLRWWHISSSSSSAGSSAVPARAPAGTGPAGGRLVATDIVDPALSEAVLEHARAASAEPLPIGFRWHPDTVQIMMGTRTMCTVRIPTQ